MDLREDYISAEQLLDNAIGSNSLGIRRLQSQIDRICRILERMDCEAAANEDGLDSIGIE